MPSMKLTIDCATPLYPDHPAAVGLLVALASLHRVVPGKTFELKKRTGVNEWEYSFVAADDRKWDQVIRLDAGGIAWWTYDVPDYFSGAECAVHDAVRTAAETLIRDFACGLVDFDW